MPRQSKGQKGTVARVMHEFKKGELRTQGTGPKVKNRRQAIAIALHESGATNTESPRKNKQTLAKTQSKERKGLTAEARKEGKTAQKKTMTRATQRKGAPAKKTASTGKRKITARKTTARKTTARKPLTARKSNTDRKATAATRTVSKVHNVTRDPKTKAMLYAEAKRRNIPGRSSMSKSQLEKALG